MSVACKSTRRQRGKQTLVMCFNLQLARGLRVPTQTGVSDSSSPAPLPSTGHAGQFRFSASQDGRPCYVLICIASRRSKSQLVCVCPSSGFGFFFFNFGSRVLWYFMAPGREFGILLAAEGGGVFNKHELFERAAPRRAGDAFSRRRAIGCLRFNSAAPPSDLAFPLPLSLSLALVLLFGKENDAFYVS